MFILIWAYLSKVVNQLLMSYLLQNFSSMMHFRCHISINFVTYFGIEHCSLRMFSIISEG